jgi:hypothetical protein
MKQSKLVTVPKKWKTNELAYITPAEKKVLLKLDLHGNLQDGPHKGPGGVTSLNGWGSEDPSQNRAGADITPSMDRNPNDPGWSGGAGGSSTGGGGSADKGTKVPQKKSILNFSPTYQVGKALYKGVKSIFQPKTEQQKVEANIKKGYDVNNPAEMRAAETKKTYDWGSPGGDGIGNVTTHTQSLVSAPTADQGAGFGHQWDFKAYGANQNVAGNPYDYKAAPYAKKGKMIRKYATGQEIKNFSKGKRFGPPPLKGPDSQGLPVILENSDYFKKLIG